MAGVAHADARRGGPLVAAGLETDVGISESTDLLLREVPAVLGRHLRAEPRSGVLGVLLGLKVRLEYEAGNLPERALENNN